MSNESIKKILSILKEAESQKHINMELRMRRWAIREGFLLRIRELPDGTRPDVLRYNKRYQFLFVGDSKVAKNETPSNIETRRKIRNYVKEFDNLLRKGDIKGGYIAVATDSYRIAFDWVRFLNRVVKRYGIVDGDGIGPDFSIINIGTGTWLIYW